MTITEPTARDMIPALLDRCRPDRYDPADKTWQVPVIERVACEISNAEARQIAAGKLVSVAEASATKRTNRLLREIADAGSWPMDWFDAMAWPLALDENERVSLRAATAHDFTRFSNRERRAASLDFTARNATCEGALFIAAYMDEHGITVASDIRPEVSA